MKNCLFGSCSVPHVLDTVLAQTVPESRISTGVALAASLALLLFVSSLTVLIRWGQRYYRHGQTLPLAGREFLTVPRGVVWFTTLLSLVWVAAQMAASFSPSDSQSDVSAETQTADEVPVIGAAAKSETPLPETPEPEKSAPATRQSLPHQKENNSPEEQLQNARRNIFAILQLNVILTVGLGISILLATIRSRTQAQRNSPPFEDIREPADLLRSFDSGLEQSVSSQQRSSENSVPFVVRDTTKQLALSAEFPAAGQSTPPETGPDTSSERFDLRRECLYAIEVFLAAWFPTMLLRFVLVELISQLTGEVPESNPLLEMLRSDSGKDLMLLIALTAIIMAPVAEELQFRVVLLGGMIQGGRPELAWILSSALFAMAHGFPDSLALLPLSFLLGYAYMRRRSYVVVMLIHFLFNLANIALAVLSLQ